MMIAITIIINQWLDNDCSCPVNEWQTTVGNNLLAMIYHQM